MLAATVATMRDEHRAALAVHRDEAKEAIEANERRDHSDLSTAAAAKSSAAAVVGKSAELYAAVAKLQSLEEQHAAKLEAVHREHALQIEALNRATEAAVRKAEARAKHLYVGQLDRSIDRLEGGLDKEGTGGTARGLTGRSSSSGGGDDGDGDGHAPLGDSATLNAAAVAVAVEGQKQSNAEIAAVLHQLKGLVQVELEEARAGFHSRLHSEYERINAGSPRRDTYRGDGDGGNTPASVTDNDDDSSTLDEEEKAVRLQYAEQLTKAVAGLKQTQRSPVFLGESHGSSRSSSSTVDALRRAEMERRMVKRGSSPVDLANQMYEVSSRNQGGGGGSGGGSAPPGGVTQGSASASRTPATNPGTNKSVKSGSASTRKLVPDSVPKWKVDLASDSMGVSRSKGNVQGKGKGTGTGTGTGMGTGMVKSRGKGKAVVVVGDDGLTPQQRSNARGFGGPAGFVSLPAYQGNRATRPKPLRSSADGGGGIGVGVGGGGRDRRGGDGGGSDGGGRGGGGGGGGGGGRGGGGGGGGARRYPAPRKESPKTDSKKKKKVSGGSGGHAGVSGGGHADNANVRWSRGAPVYVQRFILYSV